MAYPTESGSPSPSLSARLHLIPQHHVLPCNLRQCDETGICPDFRRRLMLELSRPWDDLGADWFER
ncbi:hypothetical protein [Acetobacter orleanensis]|uniref:Uncharacterized protein n=1 Tax=Acetobacter orleanensis TaxID=104099 RepID=A0A4Y3TKG2_9PROT|nr:hypothetical protein [Acetobacter orleanensis]GAN68291.1 hypothetical protein Abol_015_130 [Acetobacter orleanensis JCM 7639]GBR31113.1 hypothetical protein AA0473_2450 [Acetobacter orleanensis NRIC 0473]GEB82816.1 hypothetical protein AOR01nite_12930 [Acetobacter orleanensis]